MKIQTSMRLMYLLLLYYLLILVFLTSKLLQRLEWPLILGPSHRSAEPKHRSLCLNWAFGVTLMHFPAFRLVGRLRGDRTMGHQFITSSISFDCVSMLDT
ncbi:hypothetical protein CPB83DRAFT_851805 [Crepidotus variabilis]|uniref:Uncharacterized protein n=1 Tax=Crepidotus variabilis TaxID=179855 RepID=A0A9P6EHS9_9AGAR|nr:hypothetical protein CPB83DRAFT_851805 [Crepidotus variabilis]